MQLIVNFLGRLHPLVGHLPIGFFIFLIILEYTGYWNKKFKLSASIRHFTLTLGILFAVLTATFGLLLAQQSNYSAFLLNQHRLYSLIFTALTLILYSIRNRVFVYRLVLVVSLFFLIVAGHLGARLTHGDNYFSLIQHQDSNLKVHPQTALIYSDVIQPLFQERCVACHGSAKNNGDLRLDTNEEMLKGGKTGFVFKAGDATSSLIIKRIHLSLDSKEHMPPKGKVQLSEDEDALLQWWIDIGAPTNKHISDISVPTYMLDIIYAKLGVPPTPLPDRLSILDRAHVLESKFGIIVHSLSAESPYIEVNARFCGNKFGDDQLQEIADLGPAIQVLDLGLTGVTDRGLVYLGGMKHLQRLQLDHTRVTSAGLGALEPLTQLESLNLYSTDIDDLVFKQLKSLPSLRHLYLWNTQVSKSAAKTWEIEHTNLLRKKHFAEQIESIKDQMTHEDASANVGESFPNSKK